MKFNVDGIEFKVYGYFNVVLGKFKVVIVGGNVCIVSF